MVGRGERTTCSLRRLTRQKVFGFIPETFLCGFEQVGVKNG